MREIVTVQVGSYANFIGSHFWNFQDELLGLAEDPEADMVFKNDHLNMDVLYRAGETHQGLPTYTPRLLSVDFQGSLGSMSSCGTLYNEIKSLPSDVVTWAGGVSTHASEPLKKNLFLQSLDKEEIERSGVRNGLHDDKKYSNSEIQDKDIVECLENVVQYWTDYSKVHYHPQSLYEISGLWMDIQEFDNYGIGRDTFLGGLRGEEINERLRFFVEECDHIQGIQFIVDNSGGFSGVAAEFLENIADDFPNVPLLLYSVRSPEFYMKSTSRKQMISQNLHDAVSFSRLSSLCKLIVPVGLPSLSRSPATRFLFVKDEKPYHSSAIYASALHSISLPFRMEPLGPTKESSHVSGALDMNHLVEMLAGQNSQNMVLILDVAMPFRPFTGQQNELSLLQNLQPLTPEITDNEEDLQAVESMIIHGALLPGGHRASISEVKDAVQSAYQHAMTRPMFSHLSVAVSPLPIPLPFPSIFRNSVGQHGELLGCSDSVSPSKGSLDVHSVPMAARLRSSNAIWPFLEKRLANLCKFGIERGAVGTELVRSWGFGREELEDIQEALSKLLSSVDPRPQEFSDSD